MPKSIYVYSCMFLGTDLYTFIKLKWERYNLAPFMEGWHIKYLAKVLENTLPSSEELITRLMINMPPSYNDLKNFKQEFKH